VAFWQKVGFQLVTRISAHDFNVYSTEQLRSFIQSLAHTKVQLESFENKKKDMD
jgi:hypothetical protein